MYSETLQTIRIHRVRESRDTPLSHPTVHISFGTFDVVMEVIPEQLDLGNCFERTIRRIEMTRKQNLETVRLNSHNQIWEAQFAGRIGGITKRDISNFALSTPRSSAHCLSHLRQPSNLQWWLPVRKQHLWCILQRGTFPRIHKLPQKHLPKNMINLLPEHSTENNGDTVIRWGNVDSFFFAVVDCGELAGCAWRGRVGSFEGGW
jgi:hypothetical protein